MAAEQLGRAEKLLLSWPAEDRYLFIAKLNGVSARVIQENDQVDALSLALQGKVLAILEHRAVRRLGGVEARSVDVRIIVATHVDLDTAARRGTFRADLLGRFARSTLTLVPLRERPEDILPLARHFAGQVAQRHGEALRLTTDAEEELRCYPWPGNIRELSDVIERAARRRARDEIGAEELGLPRA